MTPVSSAAGRPPGRIKFAVWMVALAVLFAGFCGLGTWQVQRYRLKRSISDALHIRVRAPPVPAPGPAQWPSIVAGHGQYLHVRLQGHYLAGKHTLVRGTSSEGYGYWVMAPFETQRGFVVLVNRGYMPPDLPEPSRSAVLHVPPDDLTLTGLLRNSEPHGGFLRANEPRADRWYSRDVAALAAAQGLPATEVAPYFVDMDASSTEPRGPRAGLTRVHIYNHSMGYAVTWYLLALGCLVAAGIVVRDRWLQDVGRAN